MLREIFEQVDELTGDNPTWQEGYGDNVRSAIHAIITKSIYYTHPFFKTQCPTLSSTEVKKVGSYMIMNNVDAIARSYKHWKLTKPDVPHYLDW